MTYVREGREVRLATAAEVLRFALDRQLPTTDHGPRTANTSSVGRGAQPATTPTPQGNPEPCPTFNPASAKTSGVIKPERVPASFGLNHQDTETPR